MKNTTPLSRRHLLCVGATLWAGDRALAAPAAPPRSLPLAASLVNELALALKQGQALVVMVSLVDCPFCQVVRQSYLGPMHAQQRLPVVQVDMHSTQVLQGFDGARLSHEAMRRAWGVRIAPTVLFFGPGGKEVAPRLVGASIPDFYGAYLDQRLQQAQVAIRQQP